MKMRMSMPMRITFAIAIVGNALAARRLDRRRMEEALDLRKLGMPSVTRFTIVRGFPPLWPRAISGPAEFVVRLNDAHAATYTVRRSLTDDAFAPTLGACTWQLQARGDHFEASWNATVQNLSPAPNTSWAYCLRRSRRLPDEAPETFEQRRNKLIDALDGAIAWCADNGLSDWLRTFSEAREALDVDVTQSEGFPLQYICARERRLFYAASLAYSFGGMGWFTDTHFDRSDQKKFNDIIHRLYDAVTAAFELAVNSTAIEYPTYDTPPAPQ